MGVSFLHTEAYTTIEANTTGKREVEGPHGMVGNEGDAEKCSDFPRDLQKEKKKKKGLLNSDFIPI